MTTRVVGRDAELDSIAAFLAHAEHWPAAFVLSGESGIGKTALWAAAVADSEYRVISYRGAEAEASLSFAGLSDLLTDVLDEVGDSLLPLRREALEVALLLVKPGEIAPDPRLIGVAVLDVLRLLAEQGLLVALDDVQWIDSSTGAVLQIALRRLRHERVAVLATDRRPQGVSGPLDLERAFPEEHLTRLRLRPLSLGALHQLLKERLGLELTRPELALLQETSGGNPFFALELGRELVRMDARPRAGHTFHVPENLQELVGGRLAALPIETGEVLLRVSALARPTVELVVAAHGDREVVLVGLQTAVREGIVELDDSRLRFTHPLLASICYEQAPLWERRSVHQALAEVVADPEERARHLALAADGPDSVVASYLDAAAEQAAARGATAAAADLLELAIELEPPAGNDLASRRRRFRAAAFHRLAGNGERSDKLLEQLLDELPAGVERAEVLLALATGRRGDTQTMLDLCERALVEAEEDDLLAARILAHRSWAHLVELDAGSALNDANSALERAERAGDPTLIATAIARAGQVETWRGVVTPGLIERGAEIEESQALVLEYLDSPRVALARLVARLGELDRARAILDELEAQATARGDERTRAQILFALVNCDWLGGQWGRALERADVGLELAEQNRDPHVHAQMGRIKALVEADLGLVDEARTSAERSLALAQELSNEAWVIHSLGTLGHLELGLGQLEAAAAHLGDLPGRLLAVGLNDPVTPVWPDAIETLVGRGKLAPAGSYLDAYEENAERFGSPWAIAAAARSRGLLAAAQGDLATAITACEHALGCLEGVPHAFERGRALLCLGTVQRQAQQKRAAREALAQALALFDDLGARLWAEKARAELKRISGPRPPSDELTETEQRVATLAAQGHSNREIAAELYMGVSTVEAHLSRVYRKLGIRSRSSLAGRLPLEGDADRSVDETAHI
jgi:DNA-binding CsgD family transcriptional regulator